MNILVLSGPVAVGKSTVSEELATAYGFQRIRSGEFLMRLATEKAIDVCRASLQRLGDELDDSTDYQWLIDEVAAPIIRARPDVERWLLDSVRKIRQVEHFRARFPNLVLHAHLTADEAVLEDRYAQRLAIGKEYVGCTSYSDAIAHPNEIAARKLIEIADLVIDVEALTSTQIAYLISERLKS